MPWVIVDVVSDPSVQSLCERPYPGHRRGCPNFGKKPGCPPCPRIETLLDLSRTTWAVFNVFDLESHVITMAGRHPAWSQRQLVNCLYWQGTARKMLREVIRGFLAIHPEFQIVDCPEARGVNLTTSMASAGITLEWPPVRSAYQIVLAGSGYADLPLERKNHGPPKEL